jgi:urease accessory protein
MKTKTQWSQAARPWVVLGTVLLGCNLVSPSTALAHPGHGINNGFVPGMTHPLTGLDHICAMLAVGLWAAQRGGRALWAVPLAFVSVMALGAVVGMRGVEVPYLDKGIAATVLLLGVFIAAAVRLPLVASATIVGLFALLHGYAHGFEAGTVSTASSLLYGAGFILSTIFLHLTGIGLGLGLQRVSQLPVIRYAGAAIALCGVLLLLT